MSGKKLRVAVVGGGFGRYGFAAAFLKNPRIEMVACCTRHVETAEKFARQYQIPKAYADWKQLLEEEIDVLAVATPPQVQAEITKAALQKKIPLFLEKQIALTALQSKELFDLANQSKVPTCVNFIFPYLRTWQEAQKYLKRGLLGKIRHAFLNWRMESYDNRLRTATTWKTNDELGGGILQHFLSHSLHYLENFFGQIRELRCTLEGAADLNAEGSSFASLDLLFGEGTLVHIAASSSAYSGIGHSLEIYGSEGSLLLKNEESDPTLGFKLYYAPRGKPFTEVLAEEHGGLGPEIDSRVLPTGRILDQFVDTLSGTPPLHPTIADGHRVQILLDCARAAHVSRNFIKI